MTQKANDQVGVWHPFPSWDFIPVDGKEYLVACLKDDKDVEYVVACYPAGFWLASGPIVAIAEIPALPEDILKNRKM